MENYRRRSLVVTEGPNEGATYPLESTIITLGRATDNTIVLDSGKVSRQHAQIRLSPTGAVVEDLGSTNGTWVNGERILEPHTLKPGDLIRLADYVAFEYLAPQQPESTARMAPDWQQAPPQGPVRDYGYGQPQTRPYQGPDDLQPYEPPAPPETPRYTSPPPDDPPMAYVPPTPSIETEEPAGKQRPKWLYAVIGLLAVLLCLCVALAVYIWFAPPSFWERLFNLFNVPLPEGYLDPLTLVWLS